MEELTTSVNSVFDGLGVNIKAHIDDEATMSVRDLIVILSDAREFDVYEAPNIDTPIFKIDAEDIAGCASIITFHVVKKMIANVLAN